MTVNSNPLDGVVLQVTQGGTGVSTSTRSGNNVLSTSPTLTTPILGTPASGTLTNCTFPTLNQNTTGSAASLSISGQTGLVTLTGLASTNRVKTVRDADDTILELGGSYTPTGTWTNLTMVTPTLGTPASGNLANCTFPTLNQNTTGSAASLSISGQSGLLTFTGLSSTNRVKTVRDAADTVLELGGSYTPTGTWTSMTLVTPALGTPASGNLSNCTGFPTASAYGQSGAVTSAYVTGLMMGCNQNPKAFTANRLYGMPFLIASTTTFTKIGIKVTTLQTGGNARLGIYNMSAGVPTSLVLDAGTVSTATTGEKEITISQSLSAGSYCLAAVFDSASTLQCWEADIPSAGLQFTTDFYGGAGTLGSGIYNVHKSFTYAALPDPFGAPTLNTANEGLLIWLRK